LVLAASLRFVAVHTGIGYLAKIISAIEDNPHAPHLTPENPLNTLLTCAASSSPDMPKSLRRSVQKLDSSLSISKKGKKGKKGRGRVDKKALKRIQEWWVKGSEEDGTLAPGLGRAMVSTTQAVDIINGGVKINALVSEKDRRLRSARLII
jgi:Gly-Xaa carboxypeptidase